ncbi:LysR family transcriptional regulator [Thalassomonas haliotis]|uniref:LysR family transcriptional regulator n=1 Tax=Thalassomonas haliotis TaxID=485448 RepID=A0ABY7VE89_9GAMM|nr:LysR family transcriptional regulator [Thalassomonas haliotis]WDE12003.1 LysR family transcriptional regulator [Thalassomonas haliotis]
MINTQVQELEIFVAVVKHRHFSKAAEEMDIAASVVSRSIQKLESKLKVKIFNRTTRKISLTQEGEWLYQQSVEIINKVADVENYLTKVNEHPQGTIRLDAATPFILHAVAPLIPGFKAQFKQIDLVLTSSESIVDLIERNIDIAIRIGELNDSTLKARKLGNSYRKIYASPDYLQRHAQIKRVEDLADHACLGFVKPDKLNSWPLVTASGDWLKVQPEVIADSGETLKQLAIQGYGLACLSSFTAEQDVLAGKLVCVLEQETQRIPIPIYAVFYSDNEMNVRLRNFLDYLIKHIYLGS